jgi:hypothetical protein
VGRRSLHPLLGGVLGFLAWAESPLGLYKIHSCTIPGSPNHPPHASLSRGVILAYAGVVVGGAALPSPFTGRSTGHFSLGGVAAGAL